jgi:hypothetical protein
MKEDTETSSVAKPEASAESGSITGWLLGVPLPVLIVVLVGGLTYGYITMPGGFTKPGGFGFADKELWNYLDVFLVPLILAVGGIGFTWHQSRRQQQAQAAQRQRERNAEVERRKLQHEAQAAHRVRCRNCYSTRTARCGNRKRMTRCER